uniref:RAP domain-containing protein n=1 Tax=Tetradesmus obliquus TaxID=3088 RepID=A0A383WBZ4_TETOB|eukprot:jgi/Sobl393_1/14/SZX74753.1
MLARLLESSTRRCPPPFCLAKDSSPTISEPVRPRTELVNGASPANQYTAIAVQALYQSGQLHAATAVSVLLDPPRPLAAAADSSGAKPKPAAAATSEHGVTMQQHQHHSQQQQLFAPQQPLHSLAQHVQQQQQQQPSVPQPAAVPHQLLGSHPSPWRHVLQRPVYVRGQVEHMVQLLRRCASIPQLQALLASHIQQMPPSCLAVAMQQLAALHHAQGQLQLLQGAPAAAGSRAVSQELAQQLSRALLQQLHAASPQALTAFLAAAASARPLALPPGVLQQLAHDLVHRALHVACQQHHQQQQQQQQQQHHLQQQQQQQQQRNQQDGNANSSSNALGQPSPAALPAQQPHLTAKAAWALAQLQLRQPALWSELASVAGEALEQLGPQDCVMLCWSMARARHKDPRVFHALLQRVSGCSRQLGPDSISCLLWSCARVGHYHHASVTALVLAAAGSMERFSPRALARCLWACGALRHYEPRLLRAARVRALASMHQFEPHSCVLVMCALAKFGVQDEQLAAAVAGQALQALPGFTMQGLANMAWAVAKLQQQGGQQQQQRLLRVSSSSKGRKQQQDIAVQQVQRRLLAGICAAAAPRLATAKPQEVCNLLWACAIMKLQHQGFLEAAGARLAAVAEDASPRDLAQAVWAFEVLQYRRKAVQQVLVLQALNKLHLFGAQALSNWAWAVASAGMQLPRGLPAAVAQQFQVLLPQLTAQGTATTLWALGKMGKAALTPQVMHAASSHILVNLACYNAQDLCNVVMVCCKAGYKEPMLLQGLAGAAAAAAAATLASSSSSSNSSAAQLSSGLPAAAGAPRAAAAPGNAAGRAPVQLSSPLAAAARSAVQQKQLTPQGVCNLVWAFAGLGWHDPLLLQQLQQLAVQLVMRGKLQPERIAGLLQGFALLGESCEPLLAALAAAKPAAAQKRDAATGKRHLGSNSSQAHLSPATQPQLLLQCWPADALALLVWAAAASSAHHVQGALVVAALRQLQVLGVSGCSQARKAQLHEALVLLATDWGMVAWGDDGGLGWSNTTSSSSSSSSSRAGAQAAPCRGSPQPQGAADSIQPGEAGAAGSTHQHCVVQPPEGAASVLSGRLVRQCAAAWQEQQAEASLCQVEEEVAQALQSMGLQPLLQRWVQPQDSSSSSSASSRPGRELGGWSHHTLRVAVGVAGASLGAGRRPVAIEVLPPAAASSSWPSRVLGRTALGQRCLQAAGWQVVCISWEEWEGLAQQRGAQRQLLQRVLCLIGS